MKSHRHVRPPRLAEKIFLWYCADPLREEIAGDLEERFLDHVEAYGLRKARLKYWLNVMKFFRWHTLKRRKRSQSQNQLAMFRNYFKIAVRSSFKHWGYSFINVFGLVAGLTSCILIMLYAEHHMSFDKFHKNFDSIYRVSMGSYAITPNALGAVIQSNFPDEAAQTSVGLVSGSVNIKADNHDFSKKAFHVDKDFLNMFSFPLLVGDASTALRERGNVAISRSAALSIFNRLDVVGEEIICNEEPHYVTAVFEDVPANSSMQFDILIQKDVYSWAEKTTWSNASFFTFVRLADEVNPQQFQKKYNRKINEISGEESDEEAFVLHPFSNIHLQKEGKLNYEMFSVTEGRNIYIFSAVAIFILLIAGMNYVNLATSRSLERAKEVGVRKVSGALKSNLIVQFLAESALFVIGALILSVMLSVSLLPSFNELSGVSISVEKLLNLQSILKICGVGLLMSLLSGFYPAMALSRFQPVKVLKGNFGRSGRGGRLRKVLVVFQFVISAFLFIATLAIGNQFDYIMDKDLGMQKDQVLIFSLPSELRYSSASLKSELLANPGVTDASVVNNNPLSVGASHGYRRNAEEDFRSIRYLSVDEDFVKLMRMELVAGVGFDELMVPFDNEKPSYILNETAVRELGLTPETAVGENVDIVGKIATIQAVVKDFHFESLTKEISPLVILNHPRRFYYGIVKVRPEDIQSTLSFIEARLKEGAPNSIFEYRFLDDAFASMYTKTAQLKTIFQLFSNLAVLIACLGMLGLIAFTAQNRAKEVGVRKVLGASVSSIVMLLSGDFFKLLGIALLIALPAGYYAMDQWLNSYAYRTELGLSLFVVVVLSAAAITFLTISFQATKTARTNPASILRNE